MAKLAAMSIIFFDPQPETPEFLGKFARKRLAYC